jgi:hypothetical protein
LKLYLTLQYYYFCVWFVSRYSLRKKDLFSTLLYSFFKVRWLISALESPLAFFWYYNYTILNAQIQYFADSTLYNEFLTVLCNVAISLHDLQYFRFIFVYYALHDTCISLLF